MDIDTTGYYALGDMVASNVETLVRESIFLSTISLAAVFVVLLFFMIIIAIMVHKLLKPLGFFAKILGAFSEGNFTSKLPDYLFKQNDEIGEISKSFEDSRQNIMNLISMIKNQSLSLQTIGEELADQMSRTTQAINGITSNIKDMKDQVGKQESGVTETGKTVSEIMETANQLHELISVQTENVLSSSKAIDVMLKNSHLVVETLTENTENI
jgi:methyl-accepting chemotaxis protein